MRHSRLAVKGAFMYLYPVGRGIKRLTRDQFLALRTVNQLDPEVVRRDMAMMDAAQDAGVFLSFSGGWRDGDYAESEFFRRYTRTLQTRRQKITDKRYDSAWWSLNAGEIGAATPWNGLHTYGRPGTAGEYDPLPQSADFYGDLKWAHANCARFGLRWFPNIPSEPHHFQPVEGCTSRDQYNPTKHRLRRWPLDRNEDDMQRIVVKGDIAGLKLVGDTARWEPDGTVWAALETITGPVTFIDRAALKAYAIIPPYPNYDGVPGYTGGRTVATDFRQT